MHTAKIRNFKRVRTADQIVNGRKYWRVVYRETAHIFASSLTASLTDRPRTGTELELEVVLLLLKIFSSSVLAAWAPLPAAHAKYRNETPDGSTM